MAGDWIKVEHCTPDKPEVVRMAAILEIDQDAVVGKLLRLWIWADQQSTDGNALPVTDPFIDRITHLAGFADALRKVGWLKGRDSLLSIPNFGKHNGQSAKLRSTTNDRVAKHRKKCNAKTVTDALPKSLPEKRREDSYERERDEVFTNDLKSTESPDRLTASPIGDAIPPELPGAAFATAWEAWLAWVEEDTGRPATASQRRVWLKTLAERGPEKAIRDLEYTIGASKSHTIYDSDRSRPAVKKAAANPFAKRKVPSVDEVGF